MQEWLWDKASVFWVRPRMYLVFKCSLTCRLSSCMWACVAAAVHIVTNCPYAFFNRCALETWGVMLRVTSSPGLSLLTWMSELCLQSCSDAYMHTDLLNYAHGTFYEQLTYFSYGKVQNADFHISLATFS